jgi:hypothetical protein
MQINSKIMKGEQTRAKARIRVSEDESYHSIHRYGKFDPENVCDV